MAHAPVEHEAAAGAVEALSVFSEPGAEAVVERQDLARLRQPPPLSLQRFQLLRMLGREVAAFREVLLEVV